MATSKKETEEEEALKIAEAELAAEAQAKAKREEEDSGGADPGEGEQEQQSPAPEQPPGADQPEPPEQGQDQAEPPQDANGDGIPDDEEEDPNATDPGESQQAVPPPPIPPTRKALETMANETTTSSEPIEMTVEDLLAGLQTLIKAELAGVATLVKAEVAPLGARLETLEKAVTASGNAELSKSVATIGEDIKVLRTRTGVMKEILGDLGEGLNAQIAIAKGLAKNGTATDNTDTVQRLEKALERLAKSVPALKASSTANTGTGSTGTVLEPTHTDPPNLTGNSANGNARISDETAQKFMKAMNTAKELRNEHQTPIRGVDTGQYRIAMMNGTVTEADAVKFIKAVEMTEASLSK